MRRYGLFLLAFLLMIPFELVLAQDPTPSGGLGGFLIPTSTPESGGGGLGGFLIPTSTPGGDSEVGESGVLPDLDDEQLLALNLQEADVPQEFSANQEVTNYIMADTVEQIRAVSPELADRMAQIVEQYGWEHSIGVTYSACVETIPISEIYSEVGQLTSPELARAFIDDPAVSGFYQDIGYELTSSTTLHGWLTALSIEDPGCFAQEIEYGLNVEYWGLIISVSMTANADTDPALVYGLIDELIPALIARVVALAADPFPPTPIPTGNTIETSIEPTFQPTFAAEPTLVSVGPPGNVATVPYLEALMPTIEELGLESPFAQNRELSHARTAAEYVAFWQGMGLTDVANAISTAAEADGLIGNVIYVWDTGDECPDFPGLSVEITLSLFETEQGAQNYLYDQGILSELAKLGITVERRGGGLLSTVVTPHTCGDVVTYSQAIQHGRILVASSVIAYPQTSTDEAFSVIDALNSYMVQKIDQAGVE